MALVVVLLAFLLLAVVVAVISAPLRASLDRPPGASDEDVSPERAELEAEREAKYREIRDAELDFRTGKLSSEDYASLDATLRAEAVEILDRLETLGVRTEPLAERTASATERAESNPEVEG